MQTAQERANWFVEYIRDHPDADSTWRLRMEFLEYARDQAARCSDMVWASMEASESGVILIRKVANAVANAPFPGEG